VTANGERRTAKVLVAVALLLTLAATTANACPVCFGDPGTPAAKGMNNAIWFLLGTIGFVQIGFVALFVTFWRRARDLRRRRESFQLLQGGAR
jgi:hypothetical protein